MENGDRCAQRDVEEGPGRLGMSHGDVFSRLAEGGKMLRGS